MVRKFIVFFTNPAFRAALLLGTPKAPQPTYMNNKNRYSYHNNFYMERVGMASDLMVAGWIA
jgi:hypothetical protein